LKSNKLPTFQNRQSFEEVVWIRPLRLTNYFIALDVVNYKS
jgi:hypothetical protein